MQLVDRGDARANGTEGQPDHVSLVVGIDAESTRAFDGPCEVCIAIGLERIPLLWREHFAGDAFGVLGRHDVESAHRLKLGMDASQWRMSWDKMNVAGTGIYCKGQDQQEIE